MENYQPGFAAVLAASFLTPEEPQPWETAMATSEHKQRVDSTLQHTSSRDRAHCAAPSQKPGTSDFAVLGAAPSESRCW